MAGPNTAISKVDGTLDFSGGVNSVAVSTIASDQFPNGLKRNELAWLTNGIVRDGGVTPRGGWQYIGTIHPGGELYQSGWMYEPTVERPWLMLSIGGHIYRVGIDPAFEVVDLTAISPGTANPATVEQGYMQQGETFLVIQAGDGVTNPLYYNGTNLWRSAGLAGGELPPATAMDYHMGRLWYAQNRTYSAGDIVGGPSGTPALRNRDSILHVTENPLAVGGDGFTVPDNAGVIRAIKHNANLDSALGQGSLFVFTRKTVYRLSVPVTRTDWIAATTNNQPLQDVVLIVNGAVNDRCVVPINGDLFFQSLEPSIRSLISAIRDFTQWGNVPVSANLNRVLRFVDRSLLHGVSGVEHDNRVLQSTLPKSTDCGIVSQGVLPIEFTPISTFGAQRVPVAEGMWEGLDFLQFFRGDFGGLQRCFGVVRSDVDGSIQLWELTSYLKNDHHTTDEKRITVILESPAFTWNNEFELKELLSLELWIDRIFGRVDYKLEWRPDGDPCWHLWHEWFLCSAKDCTEDVENPCGYPTEEYGPGFRSTVTLPRPPADCTSLTGRPASWGYQFQVKLTFTGFCRIRGILLHATPRERKLYDNMLC